MSEHLQDIRTYYFLDQEDKREIKAISEVDCNIIEYIILISERVGSETFKNILSNWKLLPDAEILEQLDEYLTSDKIEEDMKSGGGDLVEKLLDKMKRSYIKIGENTVHVDKIFVISLTTEHNGERPKYCLVVNDERFLPDKTSSWYSGLKTSFNTEVERDDEFKSIKKLIGINTMCKFVN